MWKWASPWALVLPEARTSSVYPSSFFFLYSMCTVRRYFVLYCTYTYVLLCCLSRLFSYKAIMSDVATAAFDRTTITDFSLSLSLSLSLFLSAFQISLSPGKLYATHANTLLSRLLVSPTYIIVTLRNFQLSYPQC